MLPTLFLSSVFIGGFCVGYGIRAWRSRKRPARSSYDARAHLTTFGHARRAF